MKKRICSLFMALVMAATLLPTAAMATNGDGNTKALQYDDYVPISEFGASSMDDITITPGDGTVLEKGEGSGYIHAVGIGEATVQVDDTTYNVTVAKAKLNIVLVSGQSNANGVHGGSGDIIAPDLGNGYIWSSSGLSDLGAYAEGQSTSTGGNTRSVGWYPALAAEWYALTGEKTVIIHSCTSGSPLSGWASYEDGRLTARTTGIATTVTNCINALKENANYDIVRTGYYWLQGETDAFLNNSEGITDYTTAQRYITAYTAMHTAFIDALKTEGEDITPYGAILSCRTRNAISSYKAIEYCGMRVAQQYLANTVANLYMASVITDEWYENKSVSYEADSKKYSVTGTTAEFGANNIHYNQIGYNLLGLDAADNMYKALCGASVPTVTDVELIGHNGYTKYDKDAVIYAEDNQRYIGTTSDSTNHPVNNEEEDTGKAQLVARALPISANCTSVSMTMKNSEGGEVTGVMDQYGLIDMAALKTAVEANDKKPLTLTVTAGGVAKTYSLTTTAYKVNTTSFHYKWDFTDGSAYSTDSDDKMTVTSVFDENTLTYTAENADHDDTGLKNTASDWFTIATPITLQADEPWTIEWRGSIKNGTNAILLSDNNSDWNDTANGGRTTPYLYLWNGGDEGKYDVSLRPEGISGPAFGQSGSGTKVNFDAADTWKLSNDGNGSLTLSSSKYNQTISLPNSPASYTFNGLLGRFGTNNKLCYQGTIEYMEIYTPDREGEVVLTGLEVTGPDQIIYADTSAALNTAGLTVTAVYSDGSEKEVAVSDCTLSPTFLTAGDNTITVSYTEGGKTRTASFTVHVGGGTSAAAAVNAYWWDFTQASGGSTLAAVTGEGWSKNTLTYVGTMPTVTNSTFTNTSSGYFDTTTPITLSKDKAWTIEWKGGTTGQSVLLANNLDTDANNQKKEYIYIHNEYERSVSLRTGGTGGNVRLSNIPADVKASADVVWRMSHDGKGNLTISCSGTDAANEVTSYVGTGVITQDYTFNGVLGRFMKTNLCYTGPISYLKVWEEVVPQRLEVTVKEDVELQVGETLSASDVTVTAVCNDGSKKEVTAAQISNFTYNASSKTYTYQLQAVVDGLVLDGEAEVDEQDIVDKTGYKWDFTDSNKASDKVLSAAQGNNDLTYSGDSFTVTENGFTNTIGNYFTMATPVTLPVATPWTIEWKGSTTGQSVLLANNSEADTSTPNKAGPYVYIYNDMSIEMGNSVSLRKENLTAAATFTGLANSAREDENAVWYLIHDGGGNLKLACTSRGLTSVMKLENVIGQDYTFNAVLGYFTRNNMLCYNGTIQYLSIYPTAANVTATAGEIAVNTTGVTNTTYTVGEEPDLSGMVVTFTPRDSTTAQTITNYTYTTSPAVISAGTTQIKVAVQALGQTKEATVNITVNAADAPACFHWAADEDGTLAPQIDNGEEANALTKSSATSNSSYYYTMAEPVSLDPNNHWRIQWTGSMEEGYNGVLLSANSTSNAVATYRSTPYIYIRNGGDNGAYDLSVIYGGTWGNRVAYFALRQGLFTAENTWTLDYDNGTLTLSNGGSYKESVSVKLDPLVFNGIRGYFAVSHPLYYRGDLTDMMICEVLYDVTVDDAENGAVAADVADAYPGQTVTLTVTPDEGYELGTLTVTQSGESPVTVTDNTFTMPAGDVTVIATFQAEPTTPTTPTNPGTSGSSTPTYAVSAPSSTTGGEVSVSTSRAAHNRTVTITVTPDEGYELDALTVTDASGNELAVTDNGDGTYSFTMPRSRVSIEATFAEIVEEPEPDHADTCPSAAFTDVDTSAWYHEAIDYALENGLMNGVGNGLFQPAADLSRGMMAAMLYRLEGSPAVTGGSAFSDVADGQWYTDAVAWASSNSIVNGYPDGSYGPDDSITREQMAAMLYRYAVYQGMEAATLEENLGGFVDADQVSGWAIQAMNWAVGQGILTGKGDGVLDPTGTATRAEVAQIFMNFCENVTK